MAEGGGSAPPAAAPAKRGMGWRLWAVIAIVVILVLAGVAYVLFTSGPKRDTTTIVYYMQSEPVSFDSADAYDLWSFITIQNTYDTLVGYDRDTLSLVPNLALSWSATADGLHYTFNLRHDVKFADNSTFTANDVYASFKRILIWGAPTTGVDWILNQNLDKTNVSGALWVKDTYTIQMNLTQAYAGFLQTLATVEPSAIMSSAWINAHGGIRKGGVNEVNSYIQTHTMGTGPYVLLDGAWTKGTQMTLTKNQNYWRGWHGTEPTTIVIKFTQDAASRVEAVRTKSADIADLPLTSVAQVKDISGVVAKGNATVKSEILTFNVTTFPDKRVRQAFSWAFDYNGTISQAYAGFASLLPGPIPKGMDFFSVQSQVYYQDLTKAQALLDAAGFTKATSGPNAGYRFGGTAFRLVSDGTQVEETQAARIFQSTLQSIGVKTTIDVKSTTALWDKARSSGAYDFFVAHWVLDYLDPDDYVTPMLLNASDGGDYWHTGYDNSTANYYGILAKSEQSLAARGNDYQKVWQVAMDNPSMIWFCQQQYVPVHQDYVQGFWFNPVTWYNFYFYQKT